MLGFDSTPALALAGAAAFVAALACLWQRRSGRTAPDALWRTLFNSSPIPMYAYDTDSLKLVAVNETLCERYGYRASDLLGQPVTKLHIESELDELRQVIGGLRSSQDPQFRYRWTHRLHSGAQIPVEVMSRPLRRNGVDIRVVTAVDISEKLLAEQALANQHRFQESLLETLPVPVFYKDRSGCYLGVNAAFVHMMGRPREAFVGKTVWEIAPPEIAQVYHDADAALLGTPDSVQVYETQVQSDALGRRDVVFTKAVFHDHRGDIGGLVGVVVDVTAQRASEQAVRESESRLAQTLHNSPVPTFVIDAQHRVTVWNPACEYTFGIPASDMLGTTRQWAAFYDAERPCMADVVLDGADLSEIERLYHGRYRISPLNPEACEAEDFFPRMGPNGRWLYFTAAPLRDSNGTVVGAIESFIDISGQKHAQEEVERLNTALEAKVQARTQELAQANTHLRQAMQQLVQTEKLAALGSVVAGVSHELNTPMGIVLTAATSLQHMARQLQCDMDSGAGLRKTTLTQFIGDSINATDLIERNTQRAAALIRNFKDVALDPSGTPRRSFTLRTVVDDALGGLEDTLRKGEHQITVDIAEAIGMDSYPGAVAQLLTQLVSNSVLHGFDNRRAGAIAIAAQVEGDAVQLCYQDNGQGMSAASVHRAFEPFYTTKLGHGGSGLGLYTVYNLATGLLGGRIALENTPGAGLRFRITLPLQAPDTAPQAESVSGFL